MPITKKTDAFVKAMEKVKEVLKKNPIHGKVYPERIFDETTAKDLDDSGLIEAIGVSLKDPEIGALSEDGVSPDQPPPEWADTDELLELVQLAIAEAESNEDHVAMDAAEALSVNLQTQFLLGLRRVLARRSISRYRRVVRAAHRRGLLASPFGQLARLDLKIDELLATAREN